METLGHHLLHHQNVPIVFSDAIRHWPAAKWSPQSIGEILGDQKLSFRVGTRESEGVEWEAECEFVNATVSEFMEWESGDPPENNPLADFDGARHWCYCDYKHMNQLFGDRPQVLKAVEWDRFGFSGRGGEKSTFWLGSAGAHTQCHYDTYGCNLVAQIYGRKRWILFAPSQSHCMYPTRVPYEESSVFSQVNVTSPDTSKSPRFRLTTPIVVTLEPGDVMFVPRHWWHDVTSLSTSISINSWIELATDDTERVREAVTRCLVMGMMEAKPNIQDYLWLNPTEDLTGHEVNLEYLRKTLLEVDKGVRRNTLKESTLECTDDSADGDVAKKRKMNEDTSKGSLCGCAQAYERHVFDQNVRYATSHCFEDYQRLIEFENGQRKVEVPNHETSSTLGAHGGLIREVDDITRAVVPENTALKTGKQGRETNRKSPLPLLETEVGTSENTENITSAPRTSTQSQHEGDGLNIDDRLLEGRTLANISIDNLHLALVECITHPNIIGQICELLEEKFKFS